MFGCRLRWEHDQIMRGKRSAFRGAQLINAEKLHWQLPRWLTRRSAEERLSVVAPEIREAIAGWNQRRRNLLLLGPTGRGKTTAIAHLWLEMWTDGFSRARRPLDALWAKATELANARRGHPLGEGDPHIVTEAKRVGLLLLDDLGSEVRVDATIWEILDARYDGGALTVVTSGLPLAELVTRYSEAVVRRVVEGETAGQIVDVFPRAEQIRRVK
jgi:DNA replication protein DnaC